MTVKVGLVGAGRRMTSIYVPLLQKLMQCPARRIDVVGFTTRSNETAERFKSASGFKHYKTRADLVANKPDFLIVCVNSHALPDVIRSTVQYGIPMLIETPIEDQGLVAFVQASNVKVGVIEQWPYFPIEQFKERLYQAGIISRPMLVKNDCRSFDYHAIAQLRTYVGRHHSPVFATGVRTGMILKPYVAEDGLKVNARDSWELGTIVLNNGAVINHQFSYECKTAPFRSIQTLRAYSDNGTIITGRMFERNNDYEVIDIELLDDGGKTFRLDVNIDRDASGTIKSIQGLHDKSHVITWRNPYVDLNLSDQEIAIATHIDGMIAAVQTGAKVSYNINDASIDQQMITAIKYSADRLQTVRFNP